MNSVNNCSREGYTGSPRMDYIDELAYNIEGKLTSVAHTFILAPVAGVAKIICGIFQAVIASGATIVFTLMRNHILMERCWEHMKHGCGNIVAGFTEAIPTGSWFKSLAKHKYDPYGSPGPEDQAYWIEFGQEEKFLPYQSLKLRKWKVGYPNFEGQGLQRSKPEPTLKAEGIVQDGLNRFIEDKLVEAFKSPQFATLREKVGYLEGIEKNLNTEINAEIKKLRGSPEYKQYSDEGWRLEQKRNGLTKRTTPFKVYK